MKRGKYPRFGVEYERRLKRVMCMLIDLRLCVKRVAFEEGVSEMAIRRMILRHNLKERIRRAVEEGLDDCLFGKDSDSLHMVLMKIKIEDKEFYEVLQQKVDKILNTV